MYQSEEITLLAQKKNVFIYSFDKVNWGSENQFLVSLELLKKAQEQTTPCDYFHLISGVDLPIKRKEDFDAFFTHKNVSYMGCVSSQDAEVCKDRLSIYYLRNIINYRGNTILKRLCNTIENIQFTLIQLRVKIRPELKYKMYKGSQWWSIHQKVASYIIDFCKNNPSYVKRFRHTNCCDEIFFHVIVMNSKYMNEIDNNNLRYIDWEPTYPDESLPRILKEEDWESIKDSNALFCRKIDWNLSKSLIECIKKELLQ